MRRAPEGAALWTPAGALPQTPRCYASPLRLRAGRGFGAVVYGGALLTCPPKGWAGRSGDR